MRAATGARPEAPVRVRAGDHARGVDGAPRLQPGDHLRRHPRAVPRPARALPHGRRVPRDELHLHGRLCRPRVQQCRDDDAAAPAQGSVPAPDHAAARQPRVAADHAGLRLLRRVPAQVRERQPMEVLYRALRLVPTGGRRRRARALRARRALPRAAHHRPDAAHRPEAGDPARGRLLRPHVVRPGRHRDVGRQPARSWLALRLQGHRGVCADQRARAHLPRAPARAGGVQVHVQRHPRHRLVGAQLLLPMRQRRGHPQARRRPQPRLPNI
mmetsp:Transcript_14055/g.33208  ORF Transcript_14055/g.33208 Transcript_14055/m.33208 type:complete len:271 (-) Transcript_14055:229-1041(-)